MDMTEHQRLLGIEQCPDGPLASGIRVAVSGFTTSPSPGVTDPDLWVGQITADPDAVAARARREGGRRQAPKVEPIDRSNPIMSTSLPAPSLPQAPGAVPGPASAPAAPADDHVPSWAGQASDLDEPSWATPAPAPTVAPLSAATPSWADEEASAATLDEIGRLLDLDDDRVEPPSGSASGQGTAAVGVPEPAADVALPAPAVPVAPAPVPTAPTPDPAVAAAPDPTPDENPIHAALQELRSLSGGSAS